MIKLLTGGSQNVPTRSTRRSITVAHSPDKAASDKKRPSGGQKCADLLEEKKLTKLTQDVFRPGALA